MVKGTTLFILFLFAGVVFLNSCVKDKGALPRVSKGKVVIMVGASGNMFFPSSVDAKVGDTIVWRWQSGFHSVTSTSVPSGVIFGIDPIQSSSDSLIYILQIDGVYNYECIYHLPGMTGTINVSK
ncbi:MAG: hypothetical protein HY841_07695 [Bacteroidetes bacterium]|nr:hypothetical protein [Bacteroidota bacterium]